MDNHNFTSTFTVDQSPEDVFAVIKNVKSWWSGDPGVVGNADKIGDEFTYRYGDIHYSKQKVTELIPSKKIVWHVVEASLNFTAAKTEWQGTNLTFDIVQKGNKTEVRFTHVGLVQNFECYNDCSTAWGFYINSSLRNVITAGKA